MKLSYNNLSNNSPKNPQQCSTAQSNSSPILELPPNINDTSFQTLLLSFYFTPKKESLHFILPIFLQKYYNILFFKFGIRTILESNRIISWSNVFLYLRSDNRNENRGERIDPDSGNEFQWTSIGNGGGHDVRPAIDSGLSNRVKNTDYPINSTARARSDSSRPLPLLFICKSVKPL